MKKTLWIATLVVVGVWAYRLQLHLLLHPQPMGVVELAGGDNSSTIVLLAGERDCASYEDLFEALNRADSTGIAVVGVIVDERGTPADPSTVNPIVPLRFPIRPTLAPDIVRLALAMGFDSTPDLFLLDRKGRVRLVVPPARDPLRRRAAFETLMRYGRLLNTPTPSVTHTGEAPL